MLWFPVQLICWDSVIKTFNLVWEQRRGGFVKLVSIQVLDDFIHDLFTIIQTIVKMQKKMQHKSTICMNPFTMLLTYKSRLRVIFLYLRRMCFFLRIFRFDIGQNSYTASQRKLRKRNQGLDRLFKDYTGAAYEAFMYW